MPETTYTPFTYLIGWSWIDTWYYGARYAKNCHPDDLWTSYFTSSVYVTIQRWFYGEPDVIEVRKTFQTEKETRKWETRVLKRMRVVKSDQWLNKTDNKAIDPKCCSCPGEQNGMYGKLGKNNPNFGKLVGDKNPSKRPEVRLKMSQSGKGKNKKPQSEEHKRKRAVSLIGKTHSEETRKKIGLASKNRSAETKLKLSSVQIRTTSVFDTQERKTKRISVDEFHANRHRFISCSSHTYREKYLNI